MIQRRGMRITIKRVIIVGMPLLLTLYTSGLFREARAMLNGAVDDRLWERILESYGAPFGQFCITSLYSIYIKFTVLNVFVFSMKYLPTGLYLYTFIKSVYHSSKERLKIKERELEDVVLQIAIVETKQSLRESECAEYMAQLKRESARLRAARASVLDLIAADDALKSALERLTRRTTGDHHQQTTDDPDLKTKCILDLLMDLTFEKNGLIDSLNEIVEYDPRPLETVSENSEYSSISDAEEDDCCIKIIKVTNVYRMTYLKHYLKLKRLRRASKHMLLKKKMESTRKMLESWQKSLKLALCSLDEREETSEEAMGDYSKRCESDTDSELRADSCDDYPAWDPPAPCGDYFQIDHEPESSGSLEDFEFHSYSDKFYGDYYEEHDASTIPEELQSRKCEGRPGECAVRQPLPQLLEETSSQMLTIQEIDKLDNDSNDHVIAV